ncbi:hypothetical protein [Methanocaldococcus fervens]|uniref:Tetrahydromethanopterin S-methyltransferase n=1 Tax=Methanocaldococcus fervens (strain DSM 4213 / JCM 15782 / AG86) TaxID=573064 RepID=C7P5C1_METFA|nr:hypothetical protein [Methanocaldococcus fervens]ACV25299.1 hypothetical protein Mefer_1496 [Methanocaldococcus fervens AG86]
MNAKMHYLHMVNQELEELENIKRDLTRSYRGSEATKFMGYVLAGLVIISAVAPILF